MTMALAERLTKWPGARVEVTLVTQTPAGEMDDTQLPFRVVRQPKTLNLLRLTKSADLVHVAGPALLPLLFAWSLGKPAVLEHHGYQSACPNGLLLYGTDRSVCPGHFMSGRYTKCVRCNEGDMGVLGSLRALLLTFPRRWLARKVSRNIAPSLHISRRVCLPRTQVIYHGVPDRRRDRPAQHRSTNDTEASFAYVGRLVTEKGLPVLLRASRQLRKEGYRFRVKIIGDGSEREELQAQANDLGLTSDVEFVGPVAAEALPNLLSHVTAVVIPSICEDVAPLAACEQLMLGNLIIASDIGGLGEIVNGYGLKFPAGDSEALASCMRRIIVDPEAVDDLRKSAREQALHVYSEERMITEHLAVYRELLRS